MSIFLLMVLAQQMVTVQGTVAASSGAGLLEDATVGIYYDQSPDGKREFTSADAKGPSVRTGPDGKFELQVRQGILFHFAVSRKGYVAIGQTFFTAPKELQFRLDEDRSGIQLKLNPEARLGGRIVDDETTKPVAGLNVRLHMKSPTGWMPGPMGMTGADGRYSIEGVAPGEYKIQLARLKKTELIAAGAKKPEVDWTYPELYFPAGTEFVQGELIRVGASAQLDYFDFKLRKEKLRRVKGVIRAGDGGVGLEVFVMQRLGYDTMMHGSLGRLAGPGEFEILYVPEVPLRLTFFERTKDAGARRQAVVDLYATADIDDLQVNLEPALPVQVVVRTFGDHPVDGDPLWTKEKRQVQVALNGIGRVSFGSDRETAVDSAAPVDMKGVFAEQAWVSARGLPPGWVVRKVLLNQQEVRQFDVRVDNNRPRHLLEVIVGPVSNAVTGMVKLDGKPAAGATVFALPEPVDEPLPERRQKRVTVQEDGRYELRSLPPGNYRVIAVMGGFYLDGIAKMRAGGGTRIEVREQGSVEQSLEAIRP